MRVDDGGSATVSVSAPGGDPGALLSLAAQLEQQAGQLTDLGATVKQTTASILHRAEWSGDAAEGYTTFCGGTATAVGNLAAPLTQIASAIRTYASALSSAQHSVQHAVESANQAIESQAQSMQDAAQHAASSAEGEANEAAESASEEVDKAKEELDKIMEETEPVRALLEKLHLPWDLGGGLAWELGVMGKAEKGAEAAKDFVGDLAKMNKEWFADVNSLAHDADNGLASWDDVAEAASRWTAKTEAAEAFGSQWLDGAEGLLSKLKWVGRGMGVLSLVGDAGTIWKPLDSGALGWVDRGAAVVNAAAVTTSLVTSTAAGSSFVAGLAGANALDEVPVVGEVVMVADVATGLYLGGDYVVHHWSGIEHGAENAASAVGHAAESTANAVGHAASSTVHAVGGAVKDLTSWL